MFISYFKGTPEYHILRFKNGKIREQGRGISFWYGTFGTTIAMVPVTSLDNPFIFTETTANFQDLAIQGSVSYRIVDPLKAAEGFDFSAKLSRSDVVGDGREKIAERLVLAIQSRARAMVSSMTLEQALAEVTKLGGNLAELLAQRSDRRDGRPVDRGGPHHLGPADAGNPQGAADRISRGAATPGR